MRVSLPKKIVSLLILLICLLLLAKPVGASSGTTVLSNEDNYTSWASAATTAPVRSTPSDNGHIETYLQYETSDNQPATYMALLRRTDSQGVQWIQIMFPARGKDGTGWVQAQDLSSLTVVHTLLFINRENYTATLYSNDKKIFSAPIGVGRSSLPTPGGMFYIQEKFRSYDPIYGPWAMGTSAYSNVLNGSDWPGGGVIGIHGTNEPGLIPGAPSHGCIRLRNSDIARLVQLAPIGTPIYIF